MQSKRISTFAFLFFYEKCCQLFISVAGIRVCFRIITHVFTLADILPKTAFLPFFICLWFDIWFLSRTAQVGIGFNSMIVSDVIIFSIIFFIGLS